MNKKIPRHAKTTRPFPSSTIHSAVCLATGPQTLLQRALHTVYFQQVLVSLRSYSIRLLLLPRLPVTLTSIFPSITCFRRQLLLKMWPIQLAFLFSCCPTKLGFQRSDLRCHETKSFDTEADRLAMSHKVILSWIPVAFRFETSATRPTSIMLRRPNIRLTLK